MRYGNIIYMKKKDIYVNYKKNDYIYYTYIYVVVIACCYYCYCLEKTRLCALLTLPLTRWSYNSSNSSVADVTEGPGGCRGWVAMIRGREWHRCPFVYSGCAFLNTSQKLLKNKYKKK